MPSTELWNLEAESAFLACLLRNPEEYYSLNSVGLKYSDFVGQDAKRVMQAVESSIAEKSRPNLPVIIEFLKLKGWDETEDYVGGLTALPVSISDALGYAKTIYGLSVSRRITQFGTKAIEIGREIRTDPEKAVADVKAELRKIEASLPEPERSPRPDDIIRRIKTAEPTDSIPILFSPKLQELVGGYKPGELWVVGGFSSTGKSAFGVNIVIDAIRAHKSAVIFSTEMTQEQYVIRILSAMCGVPQRAIRDGISFSQSDQEALARAEQELARSRLLIYDTISYVPAVLSELVKLHHSDEGVDMVIADFLQNFYWHGDEVRDARESIIAFQNEVAKKLSCSVVVFSQLSNAYAQYDLDAIDKNYYAFKGSGAIKDASDVAIMLQRDRPKKSPLLMVRLEKNRSGEANEKIYCLMDLPTGKITEVSQDYDDDDEEV